MNKSAMENLINNQSIVYLGTFNLDFPNIKAMYAPRKNEGIKTFYLTTNLSAEHTKQILINNKVCLYFCDRRFYRGLMLLGTAEILTDDKTKRLIWKDGDEIYYPLGIDDPDYCVLKITADKGRSYASKKSLDFEI